MSIEFSSHFSTTGLESLSEEDYGSKVKGLIDTPNAWAPPFVVLQTDYYSEWKEGEQSVKEILPAEEIEEGITRLLELWKEIKPADSALGRGGAESQLLVRSSAYLPDEVAARGQFLSEDCPASEESVLESVKRIYQHAESRFKQNSSNGRLGIIVQPKLQTRAVGHLSNERRLSRKYTSWHLEWEESIVKDVETSNTFSILDQEPAEKADRLSTATESDVTSELKGVAKEFGRSNYRVHLEWVWDGATLWVVQLDVEVIEEKPAPGSDWEHEYPTGSSPDFEILSKAIQSQRSWSKTEVLHVLNECDIDHPNLFVITGETLSSHIQGTCIEQTLREELEKLVEAPVVVRTDVQTSESEGSEVFSPRSDAILDYDSLREFLVEKQEAFQEHGYDRGEFCFLIHHFISSKSCALARASPSNPKVLIDSTWGIPDGLNYYPHDAFLIDINEEAKENEQIRCKERYLDIDENGEFVERVAGKPWDWKTSVSDENLFSIARQTRRIADYEDEPTVVMFFIDLGIDEFGGKVLPWYFWPAESIDSNSSESSTRWSQSKYSVRSEADLDALRQNIDQLSQATDAVIRFDPNPDYVRDTEFVKELATLSTQLDVPIQLDGSVLSHAYYILQRSDARVQTSQDSRLGPYRRRFSKLVRDKIPPQIEAGGEEAVTRQVSSQDIEYMLKAKAVEEALEFSYAKNSDAEMEELADLFEIIRSYAEAQDISLSDIQNIAEEKRKSKGGFEEGMVLLSTLDYSQAKQDQKPDELTDKSKLPISVRFDNDIREGMRPKKLQQGTDGSLIEAPLIPPEILGIDEQQEFIHAELNVAVEIKYEEDRILIQIDGWDSSGMPGEQANLTDF